MLWALRVGWLALPLTGGAAIAHGLEGTSGPVQIVAATLAWLAWGVVLVAVLVPRTVSLTAVRMLVPASLAVAVWSSARHGVGATEIIAIAWTAAVTSLVLFVAPVSDLFVNGSSYGPERRMALRVPGTLLLGPVELTWAITVAGLCAGPLLLAAQRWIVGVVALAVGAVAARFGVRALHRLSRRWLVFVPAGIVLHDPMVLGEAVLFPRRVVRALGPAPRDTSAVDVTGRALGLVLELQLNETSKIRGADTDRLLFSPLRPGALLHEARERGLPVS
ncbi:MAG TPA: hypothetical protein VGZ52_06770 [Acidimicrobiales bacterium]|jgi:hypothetical protein|nr:hypothetical protein [Acidimicrobiales bacterium]